MVHRVANDSYRGMGVIAWDAGRRVAGIIAFTGARESVERWAD